MDHHDYTNTRSSSYIHRSTSATHPDDRDTWLGYDPHRQSTSDSDDPTKSSGTYSNPRNDPAGTTKQLIKIAKVLFTIALITMILFMYILTSSSPRTNYTHRVRSIWKPVRLSLLERLWNIMRFIVMTTAIFVGILSTSRSGASRNHPDSHRRASSRDSGDKYTAGHIDDGTNGERPAMLHPHSKHNGGRIDRMLQPISSGSSIISSRSDSNDEVERMNRSPGMIFPRLSVNDFMPRPIRSSVSASEDWFYSVIDSKINEEEEWSTSSYAPNGHGRNIIIHNDGNDGYDPQSTSAASSGMLYGRRIIDSNYDADYPTNHPSSSPFNHHRSVTRSSRFNDLAQGPNSAPGEPSKKHRRRRSSSLERPTPAIDRYNHSRNQINHRPASISSTNAPIATRDPGSRESFNGYPEAPPMDPSKIPPQGKNIPPNDSNHVTISGRDAAGSTDPNRSIKVSDPIDLVSINQSQPSSDSWKRMDREYGAAGTSSVKIPSAESRKGSESSGVDGKSGQKPRAASNGHIDLLEKNMALFMESRNAMLMTTTKKKNRSVLSDSFSKKHSRSALNLNQLASSYDDDGGGGGGGGDAYGAGNGEHVAKNGGDDNARNGAKTLMAKSRPNRDHHPKNTSHSYDFDRELSTEYWLFGEERSPPPPPPPPLGLSDDQVSEPENPTPNPNPNPNPGPGPSPNHKSAYVGSNKHKKSVDSLVPWRTLAIQSTNPTSAPNPNPNNPSPKPNPTNHPSYNTNPKPDPSYNHNPNPNLNPNPSTTSTTSAVLTSSHIDHPRLQRSESESESESITNSAGSELQKRMDDFISNFHNKLLKQKQESMQRRKHLQWESAH